MTKSMQITSVSFGGDAANIISSQKISGFNTAELTVKYWKEFDADRASGSSDLSSANTDQVNLSDGGANSSAGNFVGSKTLDELPSVIPDTVHRVSFHPLQEWEGFVLEIGEETFLARLTDITAGNRVADEQAEFLIDDLEDDDRRRIAVGGIFRWVIGYQRALGGTKKRVSHVVFRRAPQWTVEDLQIAKEEGKSLADALLWE